MKLETLHIGFYDPAERAREKGQQRRQDAREVAQGRLKEVEQRNQRLPGARPVPSWETTLPLD